MVGHSREEDRSDAKVGLILFTEAHLEYNAGLVISIGSAGRPSPIDPASTTDTLASELADYRHQLLAMARPPENPTDAAMSGSLFTPPIGVPMQNSLDLVIAYCLGPLWYETYWPRPAIPGTSNASTGTDNIRWPKRAHPGALTKAGQERTPWLTSWARPTFEQGCLSALPHFEGSRKALSLPGEHLFQASRILPTRMRPNLSCFWQSQG